MNKFCTNCGHELKPEEKFCPSCGFNTESVKQAKESVSNTQNVNSYQNTNQYQNANAYQNPNNAAFGNDDITMKNMLAQLSQKNQTNAIIWIVIGALQIIGAIYMFAFYDASIYTLAVMAIGILNIVAGYKDYKYSKELLQRPIAIISRYESMTPIVISLIYNVLFGGLIGVVGNIYELTIRNLLQTEKFFKEQKTEIFNDLERGILCRPMIGYLREKILYLKVQRVKYGTSKV